MDTPKKQQFTATVGVKISLVTLILMDYLLRNVPIETFNILFESTQNKQPYGNENIITEVKRRRKNAMAITNMLQLFRILTYSPLTLLKVSRYT